MASSFGVCGERFDPEYEAVDVIRFVEVSGDAFLHVSCNATDGTADDRKAGDHRFQDGDTKVFPPRGLKIDVESSRNDGM